MTRYAANTVRAHRAGWVAPYPEKREYIGGPTNIHPPLYDGNLVLGAVAYLTCINIALDNGTQALERWCYKWLPNP